MSANKQSEYWEFHWLTSWAEIWDESFVRQWQGWMDESPSAHVFFHPAMVKAWVETYWPLRNLQPYFIIAESANHKIFFPLVLWKHNWKNAFQRMLIPVGYSDYDYHDPIFIGSFIKGINDNFWKVFFDEVEKQLNGIFDVISVDGLHDFSLPTDIKIMRTEISPFFDLRKFNSLEEVVNSLSKRTREDVRRKKKKLEKLGKINYRIFSLNDIDDALANLPMILAEHSIRWPDSYKAPDFHKNLVKYSLPAGLLHMSELSLDDKPISWHIGFLYNSRYYWYMPVYKSEFHKYSLGQTHLFMCIEDALTKGAVIFDFLRGKEDYKNHLAKDGDDLLEFRFYSKKLIPSIRNFLSDSIKPRIAKLVCKR
jgi:CelD/BcsL family acetyltransferase involved in cellulose biosynthesis